jgi:type I restriction enzyme, S subunit
MQVATPKKGYKLVKLAFSKYDTFAENIMIPDQWEIFPLGEICNIINGSGFPVKYQTDKSEKFPFLKVSDMNISGNDIRIEKYNFSVSLDTKNILKAKICPPDSMIFPKIGEAMRTNKRRLLTKESCIDNNCMALLPKKIQSEYLFNLFLLIRLENFEQVTTLPYVNDRIIKEIKLPLPPLPEQQQIASILSNVDDTIQKTDKIIEQTQRLKKGMMQKLLIRGIGHTKFKKVKWYFGKQIEIPEDWEVVRINQLIKNKKDIRTGPFGSSLKKDVYTPSGFKIYGQENVIPDNFDIGNYYISAEKFDKMKQYEIKSGDILISLVGTHSKISLVPDNIERGIINPRLLKITFDKSKIFPQFMKIFLNSHLISEQIIRFSHGSTMDILNTEIIKQLNFLLIKHEEQKQISSILSNIDTQIGKEKLHKSNLERLKKGLMQKLLTGQIRVKVK